MIEVTRTFLEMRDRSQLNRKPLPTPKARITRRSPCTTDHYRELYRRVGEQWHWRDRNLWSDDRLVQQLSKPSISVWELRVGERLGGYFELEVQEGDAVEIVYFGLTAEFIGQGFGAAMLSRAVEEAFALGASRVWLHTCTLDSPHALPNYKARGFKETGKIEKYIVQVEGSSP
jgi:ribosomal protein S18 acetylase RimI-like enzyme